MEELESIFWQRNSDVTQLRDESRPTKKQQFVERERSRVQRENWILKIMKAIKVFTPEHRRGIYQGSKRMMSYYTESLVTKEPLDIDKNFTEELINLYIGFYSECNVQDMPGVKKVIRPNNAFIAIDLVKQLIETNRHFFKTKLIDTFKQNKIFDSRSCKLFPTILSRRQIPTQQSEPQSEYKYENKNQIHSKIQYSLLDKWQSYVNYQFPNQQALQEKFNDTYIELIQRNSNNSFIINKFQQKCYGRSKTFSYNVTGLYTQQQIKRMEQKLRTDVVQKFANIRQLKSPATAEQLKEYFKIQVQIQDSQDKIQTKKNNITPVNQWVPIVVNRTGMQHSPLTFQVVFGKELINIDQFAEKCGLNVKNYVKMIIKQKIDKANCDQIDLKNFKRHHFIDLSHAKKKQLMCDQHRVYTKQKNSSIFPLLRSNELKQDSQIALKNRSLSENKLAPIFRNQSLIKRSGHIEQQIQQVLNKSAQIIKQQQSMKLKMESKVPSTNLTLTLSRELQKRRQIAKGGKPKKVDSIIMMILNQRNLSVNV